jgi:hypothetical protein
MNAVARWGLLAFIVVGLGLDAYTHFDLADLYSLNTTGTVNEGVLFRLEAVGAVVAALLVLVRPGRLTAAIAAIVAGGGAFVLVLYAKVNVGKLGPIPNMYDPGWYTEKSTALVGELMALAGALALLGYHVGSARRRSVAA